MPNTDLLPEESPAERRARQFRQLHLLANESMKLAIKEAEAAAVTAPEADPKAKAPDHHRNFALHANAVRQFITLEIRLEGGAAASRDGGGGARPAAATLSDPRQALLRTELHRAARDQPGRAKLLRDIDHRVEQELLDDEDQEIPIIEIMRDICDDLGLKLDPSQLCDDFLYYGRDKPPFHLGPDEFDPRKGPPDD